MKRKRLIMIIIGFLFILLVIIIIVQYNCAATNAKARFQKYQEKAETVTTSYGKITYIDEGRGEVILSCHGICGGYDQAYDTLADKTDNYRVIAPSRFGYPGSDVPDDPSIENQVEAFIELLDYLKLDKVYVLSTSAGGATAIKFALLHPERTKGLILYCSGYPAVEKVSKEVTYAGPPSFICYDFPMWFFSPLFGPLMGMDKDVINTIMPLSDRHDGIVLDARISNTVMENHPEDYDMTQLQVPVLIMHSKDDKMADYNKAAWWSSRIPQCTFLSFDTGGHLMTGHSDQINQGLVHFIK